ncbi:uncharacterized protein (TIGR01777 family) [Mucilaginibacter yixingensis]|uniref:Uncharacterized protein (TIGR01777 family) n=1 Tax=Mucilaginibacter yixingensis TaxID=1295612 RepID=A0A2T5JCQ4_9SPHI|nr:uncharacterized protein (TIGR01777 family) [Mucilaginibacter yixingensis]
MKYNNIILAGGSGFLGKAIAAHFKDMAKEIIILSRRPAAAQANIKTQVWDARTEGDWTNALHGADLLVNLCGKNVNCRYTEKNKAGIFASRLEPTDLLNRVLSRMQNPPPIFINITSATIYRHAADRPQDEATGEIGDGFSVAVCKAWEKTFFMHPIHGVRKAALRMGIVLGRTDSAFPRLRNLVKCGLGGHQGNGRQMVSWIHEQDAAQIVEYVADHAEIDGVLNCTAPNPVDNKTLMQTIRKACGVAVGLRCPAWLLELGGGIYRHRNRTRIEKPMGCAGAITGDRLPVQISAAERGGGSMYGENLNHHHIMKKLIIALVAALAFAFALYFLFDLKSFSGLFAIMSVAFLLGVPFGIGLITIYLVPIDKIHSRTYCFFFAWVPILLFLALTLVLSVEGWACWLMILPVFLLLSSLGGLTARHFRLKKYQNGNTYVSVLLLLPLAMAPVEHMIGAIPGRYEAYTYIDIHAPDKATIWNNVTRVRAIDKKQDKAWLTRTLGFPRPIRAELNYCGVGGYRKAIFDKGLVFHEQVFHYEDERRMDFSIKAHPYEIPSTTMDEHVVIGGNYFDVLNGTYVLQPLGNHNYRLHLYSHFKLTTTFNFYASWWAGLIMKDIQNNILQVIKQRSEQP